MYRFFFIFLFVIACSSDVPKPNTKSTIETESTSEISYFELSASEENFVLDLRTILSPIDEIEVRSTENDKIKNILVKQWQIVQQGDQLIAYSTNKQSEFELIINNYENEKAKYAIAKAKFDGDEISKQEYENAITTLTLAQKKYSAIKDKIALIAPINGTISAVFASKGKPVSVGQTLFKIANIDTLKSIFIIDNETRKYINNKLIPEITLNNEVQKGRIDKIISSQNEDEFELHLSFPNLEHKLNMRDSISIRLDTKRKNEQMLIPKNAVFVEGEDTFVTLVSDSGTKTNIKVKVGNIIGEQIQILSGIKPGYKILIR